MQIFSAEYKKRTTVHLTAKITSAKIKSGQQTRCPRKEIKRKTLLEFFGQYRELQFGLGQRLDDGGFRIFG